MRKLLLLLVAAVLAAAFWPATARADDHDESERGGSNAAVAINTRDGSSLFRFAFQIRRVAGDVVDNQNAAVAYSQCESCRTTAIAIQIVLVTGSPSVVTPQNYAIALNESCTLCETFASAHQFVLGTGGPVRFTDEGRRELAAIRREIRALRAEDLTPFELAARLRPLVARIRTVLDTQLVPVRDDEDDDTDDEEEDDEVSEGVSERDRPSGTATTDESTTVTTPTTQTQTTQTTTTQTVLTETTETTTP